MRIQGEEQGVRFLAIGTAGLLEKVLYKAFAAQAVAQPAIRK
jgi:hypothetical protein